MKKYFKIIIITQSLFLISCGSGSNNTKSVRQPPNNTPNNNESPAIVSLISPNNNAVNIVLQPNIQLQFSESVSNVNLNTITLHESTPSGNLVAIGNITLGNNNLYGFTPISPLNYLTKYYIVIDNQIITVNNNQPINPTNFSFTTQNIITPPTVSLVSFKNGESGISNYPTIELHFSESVANVNPGSISLVESSVDGTSIPITNINIESNNDYSFKPAQALNPLNTYYINVKNQIMSISSGESITNTSFTFSTKLAVIYIAGQGNNLVSICPLNTQNGQLGTCYKNSQGINASTNIELNSKGSIAFIPDWNSGVYQCKVNQSTGQLFDCYLTNSYNLSHPYSTSISPDQKYLYITNYSSNLITKCSITKENILDKCNDININGVNGPTGLTFNPDKSEVYILNYNTNNMLSCNYNDGNILNCTPSPSLFKEPVSATLSPNQQALYVTNFSGFNISLCENINESDTCQVSKNIYTPTDIAFDALGKYAYIASSGDSKIFFCSVSNNYLINDCQVINNNNFSYPWGITVSE